MDDQDSRNVVNIKEAAARRDAEAMLKAVSNKDAKTLAHLQQLSKNAGSAGKIPPAQRPQWAKNVRSMMGGLKDLGFGVSDLFHASAEESFAETYEDVQAYSKNINAMQKGNSRKQVVGYKRYLEFIELVARLTGEDLQRLAVELTQGVALEGELVAIPEDCFDLARQLEIIANRVGRQFGITEQYGELGRIREAHLSSGGDCVWPDVQWSFEEGEYTPVPARKICDLSAFWGEAQIALRENAEYYNQTIGSLCVTEDDDPLLAEGKRSLRSSYIENPAKRRLAKNAYFVAPEISIGNAVPTASGLEPTISPFDDPLFVLPIHYAGVMVEPELLTYIKGSYLIRERAELTPDLETAFDLEPVNTYEGRESELCRIFTGGWHFAIFLYPNERCDGLIPIIRLGGEEGSYIAPLDARYMSELADAIVLPKDQARKFPYQTESLLSYLKAAITNGEIESDWEKSSYLLKECPLWNVGE
jgi:hypothetical protein